MTKKIRNFTIISYTICSLVILVVIASIIKISDNHTEKLIYATHSKVEYYAKRCYLENKCEGEITLKHLYDLGYLDVVVHPKTKEIIDENTKINYNNGQIEVNW